MATAISPAHRRIGADEGFALLLALTLHAGLAAVFVYGKPDPDAVPPPPERMTVSLAEEVALTSTSPDPAHASADVAPELGEAQLSEPAPQPLPRDPVPVPAPRPTIQPKQARPSAAPAKPAPSKSTNQKPGAARIGDDFLRGIGGDSPQPSAGAPAAAIGPKIAASLSQAIARQLKPRWSAPQGVEADRLVTVLSFSLNRDGSLAGTPRVVSQSGVTEANAPQKARHAEQAIRAVQLAAPFDLPEEYYSGWRRVSAFRFDRKLSQ